MAEAFSYGFERNIERARASAPNERRSFEDHLTDLFSIEARDNLAGGCPMTASASETARQGEEVSARFASAFEQVANALEKSLEDLAPIERRRLAVAALAAQIGAIVVSRAVAKANSSLSNEVLKSTRATISAARKVGPNCS